MASAIFLKTELKLQSIFLLNFLVSDISRSALADFNFLEMALAIFPGSLTNPSCIAAKRAVEGPSRRRSANFGAIFHNIGLQCPRALLLRELSLLSFFCLDVAFL